MRHATLFRLFLLALAMAALSGCNTLHGAGQDIEAAGETIQDAADN